MLGLLGRLRVRVGVAHALRTLASAVATVAGMLLLLADSTNDCEEYKSFKAELDYAHTCPLAGAAGNPSVSTGHVSLNIPSVDSEDEAGEYAWSAFSQAGLPVLHAEVAYSGACSGGDGTGTVRGVTLTVGTEAQSEFRCALLSLPVNGEKTVTCTQMIDAGSPPETCTMTFSPTPR